MLIEHSVGTIVNATMSDAVNVITNVMGRKPMKSPIWPGQNSSGRNAASVVAVEEMTGIATSPVAFFTANFRSHPFSMNR